MIFRTAEKDNLRILLQSSGSNLILLGPWSEKYKRQATLNLFGMEFASGKATQWHSRFQRSFRNTMGYVDWALYVVKSEKELLKNIGIYGAVYFSMLMFEPSYRVFYFLMFC